MLDFFSSIFDLLGSVFGFLMTELGAFRDGVQSIFQGGIQLTSNLLSIFVPLDGTPLGLLSLVVVMGFSYILIRIVIHLL